jgi:hypothetical protein
MIPDTFITIKQLEWAFKQLPELNQEYSTGIFQRYKVLLPVVSLEYFMNIETSTYLPKPQELTFIKMQTNDIYKNADK